VVSGEVTLSLDVFGTPLEYWILGHLDAALVVTKYRDWPRERKTHVFEKVAIPHDFLGNFSYGAVLCLRAGLSNLVL
jgi:hypothetical protein